MAVEETHEPVRSYSTEKHDAEKVEQVSDVTAPPGALHNAEGEAVSVTWKTWAVIFVSHLNRIFHPAAELDRSSPLPSVCHSGLCRPLPRFKPNSPLLSVTQLQWPGMYLHTPLVMHSDSCLLAPTLIFLVVDSSCSLEMLYAALGLSSRRPHMVPANSLPVSRSLASAGVSAKWRCAPFQNCSRTSSDILVSACLTALFSSLSSLVRSLAE